MTCPRNFTKDQIISGLKTGKTLVLDRRDAPEFADLLDLERQGLVTRRLVEFDEQSSAIKWRWRDRERKMATPLFDRVMAFDHGDVELNDLVRKVWEPTPWMINVFTGRDADEPREREMLIWCFRELGEESSPIHSRHGTWHRGNATVLGWTWYGFATEAAMQRFLARWPTPEGVTHPEPAPIGGGSGA